MRKLVGSKDKKGTATTAANAGYRLLMLVGRRLPQQLHQTEDAHKEIVGSLESEKIGAALKRM